MNQLWVATTNAGKLNEIKNIFSHNQFEVHSLNELSVYSPPKETGASFEENARIKSKSLKSVRSKDWVLADDSGLEVLGLNNMPGIHSARYAGANASDAENTAKLLKMIGLRSASHREAQFRCCLSVINADGQESIFNGILKGTIAKAPKGSHGFGYDNVFIPEGFDKTLAELTPAEKNKISHRSLALREFLKSL